MSSEGTATERLERIAEFLRRHDDCGDVVAAMDIMPNVIRLDCEKCGVNLQVRSHERATMKGDCPTCGHEEATVEVFRNLYANDGLMISPLWDEKHQEVARRVDAGERWLTARCTRCSTGYFIPSPVITSGRTLDEMWALAKEGS